MNAAGGGRRHAGDTRYFVRGDVQAALAAATGGPAPDRGAEIRNRCIPFGCNSEDGGRRERTLP
jgi:hypothetical protein